MKEVLVRIWLLRVLKTDQSIQKSIFFIDRATYSFAVLSHFLLLVHGRSITLFGYYQQKMLDRFGQEFGMTIQDVVSSDHKIREGSCSLILGDICQWIEDDCLSCTKDASCRRLIQIFLTCRRRRSDRLAVGNPLVLL